MYLIFNLVVHNKMNKFKIKDSSNMYLIILS